MKRSESAKQIDVSIHPDALVEHAQEHCYKWDYNAKQNEIKIKAALEQFFKQSSSSIVQHSSSSSAGHSNTSSQPNSDFDKTKFAEVCKDVLDLLKKAVNLARRNIQAGAAVEELERAAELMGHAIGSKECAEMLR